MGERFFEIQAQNLHDARNVKILKIHAITNKEHHRFVFVALRDILCSKLIKQLCDAGKGFQSRNPQDHT